MTSGLYSNSTLSKYGVGSVSFSGGSTVSTNYRQQYLEQQHDTSIWSEQTNIDDSSYDAVLNQNIDNFCDYLETGYEDYALEEYSKLLETMKKDPLYSGLIGEDGDETRLKAAARTVIQKRIAERTGDDTMSVEKYIKKYSADTTEKSRQQGYEYWRGCEIDEHTTEDLLEEICDKKVDRVDTTCVVGNVARGIGSVFLVIGGFLFGKPSHI